MGSRASISLSPCDSNPLNFRHLFPKRLNTECTKGIKIMTVNLIGGSIFTGELQQAHSHFHLNPLSQWNDITKREDVVFIF